METVKITKSEYENALSICNEYFKQQSEFLSIVSNEIKRLNDLQDKRNRLNVAKNWLDITQGDQIKVIDPPTDNGKILKEGEVLTVKSIDKETHHDGRLLEITMIAKVGTRKYRFWGSIWSDNELASNLVFEKLK
jgi:hypothetical protein